MSEIPDTAKGQPALREAALFGLCPKCGERTLFAGTVRFAEKCAKCGMDFTRFNVGDGPAAFLILIIGALIVGLAMWLELSTSPPWWLHVLLWLPLTIATVLIGLRVAKAWLLASEYRQRAGEYRHHSGGEA